MNTRSLFSLTMLLALTPMASADDAPARFLLKDKSNKDVIVLHYGETSLTYKMSVQDLNRAKMSLSEIDAVYFYEPPIYAEARDLYRARKFAEAKKKFQECEKAFKNVDRAPNNYATLAGFYVLECSRRMFDLKALSSEQEKFRKGGLTRETQLQQLEVNAFWEALRLKEWERLDRLAQAWHKRKVPGSQRAQIAYCHGRALEELAKKDPSKRTEALNAYNRALTADFSASIEIAVAATTQALGIYLEDPDVKLAMDLWGTKDEKKGSKGYRRLLEANALAKLYMRGGFDLYKPLKPELKALLKYELPKKEDDK
jgi:hypothetical protein